MVKDIEIKVLLVLLVMSLFGSMRLRKELILNTVELIGREVEISVLKELIEPHAVNVSILMTVYQPVRWQTDDDPHMGASGAVIDLDMVEKYRYIALSRPLLKRWGGQFSYFDYVILEETGTVFDGQVFQIWDTMAGRYADSSNHRHLRSDVLVAEGFRLTPECKGTIRRVIVDPMKEIQQRKGRINESITKDSHNRSAEDSRIGTS